MNWKIKSAIQNMIAFFPDELSYKIYYTMQRKFGALKKIRYNPKSRIEAGVNIWKHIVDSGHEAKNKVFFEIGTGRVPIIPFANFLMGAKKLSQ